MRALNPDQLRTFIEVVELGSFTAAAKVLNLSQPAVSLQVRELEGRCGVQLLDRLSKKPFPTEAGRQMLQHANRILNENDQALAAMTRIRQATGHRIRLGMTMTTLAYMARTTIRNLKQTYPDAELCVLLSPSHRLADDVRNRNVDLAIVTLPLDETHLVVQPIYEDVVHAIVPEGQFDPMPTVATPALMASAPFVIQNLGDVQTTLADTWLRANGFAAHSYVEMRNLEACRAAVAAGLGVSILPGIMLEAQPMEGLVALPLDPPVVRKLALIELQGHPVTPMLAHVRAALVKCGAEFTSRAKLTALASKSVGARAAGVRVPNGRDGHFKPASA